MKYCTNCGSPLAEGAKYCTNCGTQVAAQAPAPAPAAKKPGASSVAPVIKDLFAGASPGEMVLSNWTVAAPVKKVVAAAKTVSSAARTAQQKTDVEPERKRRSGCLRFIVRILILVVVLLILPTVLEYIGLEDVSDKIRAFFDGLLNQIIC